MQAVGPAPKDILKFGKLISVWLKSETEHIQWGIHSRQLTPRLDNFFKFLSDPTLRHKFVCVFSPDSVVAVSHKGAHDNAGALLDWNTGDFTRRSIDMELQWEDSIFLATKQNELVKMHSLKRIPPTL